MSRPLSVALWARLCRRLLPRPLMSSSPGLFAERAQPGREEVAPADGRQVQRAARLKVRAPWAAWSRRMNFWILPLGVMGMVSVKDQ